MMTVEHYVAKSGIEGLGCFLAKPVYAGTKLWERNEKLDPEFTIEEVEAMSPLMREHLERYCYWQNDIQKYVYCGDAGKYWNHSVTPNTEDRPDGTYAARHIHANEELTCDYRAYNVDVSEFEDSHESDVAARGVA